MIPIFTSNFSIGDPKEGSSILTLDEPPEVFDDKAPVSIFHIVKRHDLKKLFLLEKRFSGFRQANKHSRELGVQLVYGIKFHVCENLQDKTAESWNKTSKVNIFAKNTDGVAELMRLYSRAFTEGFYESYGRLDWKSLESISENLIMAIPFYDSFIFNNMLYSGNCIPTFPRNNSPVFLIENNWLPFDGLIENAVKKYCKAYGFETEDVKTVLYYLKKDFLAYQTFRCFERRANLEEPNMEHMSSDRFSFEAYLEDINEHRKN